MRALGLRAGVSDIQWAVLEGTLEQPTCVDHGEIVAPKTYGEAEWLAHLRGRLHTIVDTHHPSNAALKGIEPKARASQKFYPRVRTEGVAVELCQALRLQPEILFWATVSSRLGSERTKSEYAAAGEFRGISWTGWSSEKREAVMAAAAALGREQ